MIDIYCERTGAGLWAEPVNALTNIAFLIAAIAAWSLYRRVLSGGVGRHPDLVLLLGLMAAIGVGSGMWHTYATPWARLADQLPILIFISIYLLSALYRVLGLGLWATGALFVFYHVVNQAVMATFDPALLNGSIFYLPTWAAFLLIAVFLWVFRHPMRLWFALGWLLFSASLAFRSVDALVCPSWSLGTHFIWHLLNALLLYLLFAALIRVVVMNRRAVIGPS